MKKEGIKLTYSEQLARFILEVDYERMSKETIEFTKLCILDWLGSAIAGKNMEPVQMIHEYVDDMGGRPLATSVTGLKTDPVQAAIINGAASHVVELDDIHKASIVHAGTVVIPAALSIAEARNKNGKELIEAVAAGYEVCYRIGEAVSPSHYYYFHNTATVGTFGAAAAAAKLLRLNEAEIVSALGSAGTQAAGLWEFIEDGAMSKQLHPAKAAGNGVLSALLAEKGFTSAQKILEGERGFFRAMSEQYEERKITDHLGKGFKINENSFKIHASCRHTHPVVDLVLDLVKEHSLATEEITEINIRTYQTVLTITDQPEPSTVYAAKFSVQFCAALACVRQSVGLGDFTESTLVDERIRNLMRRVNVSVDPVIEAAYPEKWGASVEIKTSGGEILTRETGYPKGDPENPVSAEELKYKFLQICSWDSAAKQLMDQIMKLEEMVELKSFFAKWTLSDSRV